MSQQTINVGTAANDGTGDPLRDAFVKANANFSELYSNKAPLDSPAFTGAPTVPTAAPGTNSGVAASTAFVAAAIALAVTGVMKLKGFTDASANPNYPAATKGDAYVVTVAGKIGGASGISVENGDVYVATADNAGGTQASVGSSWDVLQYNLVGALIASNNLSDVANAATARSNIGAQAASTVLTFLATAASADAAGLRALLSLVPGTNVQAFSTVLAFLAGAGSADAAGVRALLGDAIGAERMFAGSPGAGWLLCDGTAYNQSAYPALFAVIGAIPDLATQSFVQPAGSSYVHYRCIWASSLGLYICATGNGIYTASTPGGTWTQRATGDWRDVEWSGSLLSAVGASGICSTSTDGINWTSHTAFNGGSGTAVALNYGGGVWHLTVTGGTAPGLYSATDGYTFTLRISNSGYSNYNRVRYGASTWVLTQTGTNSIKYSSDGTTWNDATINGAVAGAQFFGCVYGNGEFVALGQAGEIVASTDGHTWTGRQSYQSGIASGANSTLQPFWDGEDMIYPSSSVSMIMSRDNFVTGYSISLGRSTQFNTTIAVAPPAINGGTMVFPTATTNGLFVISKYSYDKTTQFVTPRIAPIAGSINHRTYIRAA